MNNRPPLNGKPPHTMQELHRSQFDWADDCIVDALLMPKRAIEPKPSRSRLLPILVAAIAVVIVAVTIASKA